MKVKMLILFALFPLLCGCIPTNTLDQTLMVEGEGFDYIGHGKVMGTVVMPSFIDTGTQGSQGTGIPATASMIRNLSGVTYDGKSLVDKFQSQGQEVMRVGSMKVMLFNKKMAEHGLSRQMSFRNRDPDVPSAISVAVVEGSTKKILTATDYQTQIPIARYIQHMIAQNSQQNYPTTNLRYFLDSYYGDYMDPFMPIILKNGDHLEIDGLALFRKAKYVMRIGENKMFLFKMLYEKFNQGVYDYQFSSGKHVAIRNVQASVKYHVVGGNSASPKIIALVNVKGYIRQASPKTINTKSTSAMERKIAESLSTNAEKMVCQFQKRGTDPLRLGDTVRSFTHHFDGKTWDERYPNADFHCRVQVKIVQTGISS
ncbi:Ger(x)C family spore germination protein [Sporolactobacillus shoreicorticis]|uniref:Ger(X)C family spore germination protein n=1 Tax=Sporolactobacillus shoreicorticis TaxID=1923877 RepID=A0ABW5S3W0_9BACL|nr:Ger(x)C family spore germination protein [Sporolactobacillus shoreicorticis]MCO7124644.1 Ger(x)C family spore germination protein [Sporolactobacillus shoreicorticis]